MSKIDGFYQLREMFSGEVDEELWKVKEETLLQDELATAIRESMAQVLSEVRSPIRVTIDYEPKGDIAVKVSLKETDDTSEVVETPAFVGEQLAADLWRRGGVGRRCNGSVAHIKQFATCEWTF